jgi:toxin ParE1/3/4
MPSAGKASVEREIIFAPEAHTDLIEIYDYIAERADIVRALGYVERITEHCLGLANFPERGIRRDDLRPGLRVTGFERRVSIAFHVTETTVVVDRILCGGRDLEAHIKE